MRAAFAARRQGADGRHTPAGRAMADPRGPRRAVGHTEEAHGISAKSTDTQARATPTARLREKGGPRQGGQQSRKLPHGLR